MSTDHVEEHHSQTSHDDNPGHRVTPDDLAGNLRQAIRQEDQAADAGWSSTLTSRM